MPKLIYNWNKVKAGDIISFRYRSKEANRSSIHSVLVLNPRLIKDKKQGQNVYQMHALKLESLGSIPTIRSKPIMAELLNRVGDIEVVSGNDYIYRLKIKGLVEGGIPETIYQKIKKYVNKYSVYRTYDYRQVRRAQVFLEPIELPSKLVEVLLEN